MSNRHQYPFNGVCFNFHDRLLDCEEKKNMITFYGQSMSFHCHKQLLTHHSTYFNSETQENLKIELNEHTEADFHYHFLQISHGVRSKVSLLKDLFGVTKAQKYGLDNVHQLIDQETKWNSCMVGFFFPCAIRLGLRHWLASFLREQETIEELKWQLERVDLETIPGEMMKECVKRFFEFVIPNKHFC
uniref:BTB domain-containing protein n=1 Tax=Caenorhabditis tropicalis TaxID=1561998 RepID=A0A1I7TB25_9PELO